MEGDLNGGTLIEGDLASPALSVSSLASPSLHLLYGAGDARSPSFKTNENAVSA